MESFQEFNRHKTLLTVTVAEVNVVPGRVVLVPNFGDGREKKKNQADILGQTHDSSILWKKPIISTRVSSSFQCFCAQAYSSKVR